eukprot:31217-Pelagococcus_subviridis.AAC.2
MRPSARWKSSTPNTPAPSKDATAFVAAAIAASAVLKSTAAGVRVMSQMLFTCSVSVTGYAFTSPVLDRITITASSRRNGTHRSTYNPASNPPSFATASATSAAVFATALPLPSYAMRRDLIISGNPNASAAAASSASSAMDLNSPRGTPAAAKCSFCRNLSWMIASVRDVGWTSTPIASSSSSAATSMCSISTVTTSQSLANARTSSLDWNDPSVATAATLAGATGFGSSARRRTPMGAAAMASILPSCPPPRMPTFAVRSRPSGTTAHGLSLGGFFFAAPAARTTTTRRRRAAA